MFALGCGRASGQEIKFEILEKGDCSGYCEEAYIVVKTEAEWVKIWERHTFIRMPHEPPPCINFSRSLVVCAFMGKRPTTGYSINIERVWTDGEHVYVKVVKQSPYEGLVTCQMVTCPYVMILMEKMDIPFVFWIVDENGETGKHKLTEYSPAVLSGIMLTLLLMTTLIVKKLRR
ncbi:MAG: protease complex subunit PrcB family protein [Candidatus Bathyarchaeia archaeon]